MIVFTLEVDSTIAVAVPSGWTIATSDAGIVSLATVSGTTTFTAEAAGTCNITVVVDGGTTLLFPITVAA